MSKRRDASHERFERFWTNLDFGFAPRALPLCLWHLPHAQRALSALTSVLTRIEDVSHHALVVVETSQAYPTLFVIPAHHSQFKGHLGRRAALDVCLLYTSPSPRDS